MSRSWYNILEDTIYGSIVGIGIGCIMCINVVSPSLFLIKSGIIMGGFVGAISGKNTVDEGYENMKENMNSTQKTVEYLKYKNENIRKCIDQQHSENRNRLAFEYIQHQQRNRLFQ